MDKRRNTTTIPDGFDEFVARASSMNEIVKQYKDYGSYPLIKRWIVESNLSIPKSNQNKSFISKFPEAISMVREKKSIEEIKEKYPDISFGALKKQCRKHDVDYVGTLRKMPILPPPEDILTTDLVQASSMNEVCAKYNTSLPVLFRWCRELGIDIKKYNKQTTPLPHSFADDCENMLISEVKKKHNMVLSTVRRLAAENGLTLTSATDIQKANRNKIADLFDEIVSRNDKESILQIVTDLDISYEVTKLVLRERGYIVKIHNSNKSKGELDVLNFFRQYDDSSHSTKRLWNGTRLEIDCFSEKYNFGVEYCGEYWHSIDKLQDKNYHQKKLEWAKEQGFPIMTIFEQEWLEKQKIVKSMIGSRLGVSKRVFARNCSIEKITSAEAKSFHTKNHISGYVPSSKNYGLKFENNLISVMSFARSRYNKKFDFEITRYSSKLNTNVIGGASKLFSMFNKDNDFPSVISYSNRQYGEGNVYLKLGLKFLHDTPPSYFYFQQSTQQKHNRLKFQKHKLKEALNTFDELLTEEQNMINNGYYRVYDCGNNVYGTP